MNTAVDNHLKENTFESGQMLHRLMTLEEHQREPRDPDMTVVSPMDKDVLGMQRDAIQTMLEVFQPRTFEGQIAERHMVVQGIVEAIGVQGITRIEPVVVWWSGQKWFVVDGHHRLIAVDRWNAEVSKKIAKATNMGAARHYKAQRITTVPVVICEGDLSVAFEETTRENGKVRLSLPKEQRMNHAWKTLVLHTCEVVKTERKFVLKHWAPILHVSERTLQHMNSIRKKLIRQWEEEQGKPFDPKRHSGVAGKWAAMSWIQAERLSRGQTEEQLWDDQRRLQEINKLAEKMVKTLGKERFGDTRAELIGEALLMISSKFASLSVGSEVFRGAMREALEITGGDDGDEDEF